MRRKFDHVLDAVAPSCKQEVARLLTMKIAVFEQLLPT